MARPGNGVARGEVSTAVILPAGMDAASRRLSAAIEVLAEPANSTQQAAAATVASVSPTRARGCRPRCSPAAQAAGSLQHNIDRAANALEPRSPGSALTPAGPLSLRRLA